LGRGLEPDDEATVKAIVKSVAANNYRFSSLVLGIVKSETFQRRRRDKLLTQTVSLHPPQANKLALQRGPMRTR
jgi:Protein of unknown function (DUF1585)